MSKQARWLGLTGKELDISQGFQRRKNCDAQRQSGGEKPNANGSPARRVRTSVRVIFAQIERTNDKRRTNWLGAMGAVAKEDERGEKRLLSLPARLIAPLIFHGMTSDELRSVGPASHLVDSPSSWLPS
ncbi:hypothetical protein PIIN_05564 [Serendipita indica DSM 11827]|uniref:Uncharacterized protein n=1 Tax=Serendipita indica (strain DSM 11827) TaxID=1109443 RepID=G4TJY5_SERID|nr:hypothetical protein PIIN_05564 [Serendipita indica DSM 11827]